VAGGDAKEEQSLGFSDSSFGGGLNLDRSTRNEGAYLLGRGRFGAFSANGGGRFDEHSQAGGEWSPQAGLRADIDASATVLRANYGEGFRAATPAEFTDPFVGNTNLGPERSQSVDGGVEQRIGEGVTAEATAFRLRTRDLIAYDQASGKLQNLDRAQVEGIEVGLSADAGHGLLLRGSFTRQRPRNEATLARLPNRPDAFATAGAEWTRGKWTLSADLYWQSSVDDLGQKGPDQGLRNSAGRRLVANVGGRWKATDSVTVFARIENLTNARYVETPSAPRGLPITFTAGITLGF
jgi:vitamin B12 transporter